MSDGGVPVGVDELGWLIESEDKRILIPGDVRDYSMDIGLPDFSGIELIERWRKEELSFPVLVLTARSQWQQKVDALENGADDYLVKPFHNEELLARLKALVRRAAGFAHPLLEAGPIKLDTVSQDVTVNDKLLELTAYEYKVLEFLMLKRGLVLS